MPHYRFVLADRQQPAERPADLGFFNDRGAIQYAQRYAHAAPVEVWRGDELVTVVEPRSALAAAD